jgi:hypothetical protein
MKPEFPRVDQQRAVSPHAQEIEYALILQRMISAVKDDPAQLRLTIYEFARARLQIDTAWAEESEQKRLADALETAILGVEGFSQRREENLRLSAPNGPAQAPPALAPFSPAEPPSSSLTTVRHVTPPPEDILVPKRAYERRAESVIEARKDGLVSTLARFCVALMLFGLVAALAYYRQRLPLPDQLRTPPLTASQPAKPAVARSASDVSPQSAAVAPAALPFPVPTDYGVYAIANDALSELHPLAERVPDKRIAVSTPVNQPSQTTLPDGKARFVVFRRDLVGNAPDRVEVRVVARVVRALTFDAKGKPNSVPVSGTWNMRNVAYEFRVRPVAGNPEMLFMQSDKPDFELPAGRYVLVLKEQGYDFTVPGKVTAIAHCLERTEAANGTFYSECQKP